MLLSYLCIENPLPALYKQKKIRPDPYVLKVNTKYKRLTFKKQVSVLNIHKCMVVH